MFAPVSRKQLRAVARVVTSQQQRINGCGVIQSVVELVGMKDPHEVPWAMVFGFQGSRIQEKIPLLIVTALWACHRSTTVSAAAE